MTNSISQSDEVLRKLFKTFNRLMILYFRLGLGNIGNRPETSQIMVLIHKGYKSGLQRRTPVNFAEIDGDIYCTAAFGKGAQWYKNIQANPDVELWLPDRWIAGVAEEVSPDDPHRDGIMREVLIASGFAAPLFAGMNPRTASETALSETTARYKLIRIRPTEARTGPDGPNDLAWIWPISTLVLLLMLMGRSRKNQLATSSQE